MRNLKVLCLVVIASLVGTVSMASAAEDKIAVVDIARAIFSSDFAQARLKKPRPVLISLVLKQSTRVQQRICSHWLKKLKPSV